METNTLTGLIDGASRALGYQDIAPGGDFERATRRAKIAGVNGRVELSREMLPALIDADGRITRAPAAMPGAGKMTLAAAAAGYSRVAAAGAHVIRLPEESAAIPAGGTSGVIALQNRPAGFRLIEAATFQALTLDGLTGEGVIAAGALPMPEATIDRDALTQRAVRFEIKRGLQKDRAPGELEAEIYTALTLGIGRAMDAELLAAILATNPAAYTAFPFGTASTAAALGLTWGEIRALIGTAGAGAVADQGELFAGGVRAELTADAAETIAGAWNRAAVVYHDTAEILVERRNAQGDLVVTAWLGMAALVPTPGAFWTVGA